MEKRLFLAIVLSLLVFISWSALVPKPQPLDNTRVTQRDFLQKESPPLIPSGPALEVTPEPASLFTLSRDKYNITFNQGEAAIKEVKFKDYQGYTFVLGQGLFLAEPNLVFKREDTVNDTVRFIYRDNNKEIIKHFSFDNSHYAGELIIEVRNISANSFKISLPLVLGVLDFKGRQDQARFQDATFVLEEKTLHLNGHKDIVADGMEFIGLRDRYFCAIIEPESAGIYQAWVKKFSPQASGIGLSSKDYLLAPGESWAQKFRIYLGPQELQLINKLQPNWSAVMYYGFFNTISQLLLQFLALLYRLVHNWGLAIVILSLAIYFLFYPLTLKQMRSMKEMQAIQPIVEELRKTYKDNPQKLNKEILELYRQHKVNPFAGCLPLLVQLPVFFALYQALMRSVALKGARFLWIKDLSEPDRLFILSKNLPIIANEINILPILMSIIMFFQQRLSMAGATPSSAEQQKMMMIIFPIMFGFIFYHMPSGLVVYWFVNSALMFSYQLRINRLKR